MHLQRRVLWPLITILLLATALRLNGLGAQSIWFDEGISAHIATQPLADVLRGTDSHHPPLYYLLLNVTRAVAGDEVFVLRAPSALLGVLTVALLFQLARRLFDDWAGLCAALLAACSPVLWWASQEMRMYSLLALLVALGALNWHRLLDQPTRGNWLRLWAAELLLLYAHNTGPLQALWLNAVTFLVWLVRRDPRRPHWRTWFAGQIVLALAWAPWALTHFVKLARSPDVKTPPQIGLDLLGGMWQVLWTGPWAMVGKEPVLVGLCALLFVLALLLIPWRLAAGRWLAIHTLTLVAGLLAGLVIAGITLHGRYLVMVAPLVIAVLGGGLARVAHRWPALAALLIIPFLGTSAFSQYQATHNPAYARDDVRGMVQHYARTLSAGDSVVVWSNRDRFDLAYYWDRLGVQARRVVLRPGTDLEELAGLLPRTGKIALNVWYGERGDYRKMLDCVLAHGSAGAPVEFSVYGMSAYVYASAPETLPALRAFDASFSVARVTAAGTLPSMPADRAVCVPVRVTLLQPTAYDLRVALIVKNSLGAEIANSDVIFARVDQHSSPGLGPGTELTAFPVLRLPYGSPAGDYTVVLRLYDDHALSGYDVMGGAGTPGGKDLVLGTYTAAAGADWASAPGETDLPERVDLSAGADLRLRAYDAGNAEPVHNGGRLPITLLWQGTGPLPALTLAAVDGAWRVDIPPALSAHDEIALEWREARVPADASGGAAELRLPDGTVIARYAVEALPAAFVPPEFKVAVNADLPGIGELAGYTLGGDTFDRTRPISITLVWRAGEAVPGTSYKVFVHLITPDGRLIAQSDAFPAAGARPTSGWRAGEYIADTHALVFHADATAGPATLYLGMYDPDTMTRLRFADGADAVPLPAQVIVR